MKHRWLLLDFDNTLMATEQFAIPSLIARFNLLYAHQLNHTLTEEEFTRHFHGQARKTLCENLSRYFNFPIEYRQLYEQREWHMMQHLQSLPHGVPMADGLIETLQTLVTQSFRFALVSNNPVQRAFAAMRYAHNGQGHTLAQLFETHFFEAGDSQKPLPDVYLHALTQLQAPLELCYAVEDSITGATAAINAGLPTFGFTGFARDPLLQHKQLLDAGCIQTFHHWSELCTLIREHDHAVSTTSSV